MAEEPKQGKCEACGYETEVREFKIYNGPGREADRPADFCKVCSNTSIASAVEYPSQHIEDATILRTIGYVTNMILDAIKKSQQPRYRRRR